MITSIEFVINGRQVKLEVEPLETLLTVIRDRLGLTGTKSGCDGGECGACTVLLDGQPVSSCITAAVLADGCEVTTIEGLAADGHLHPVQQAFLETGAVQCGFCTPGMILTSAALLADNPEPDEVQIRQALAGNLCRCTGYQKVVDAVQRAAEIQRDYKGMDRG